MATICRASTHGIKSGPSGFHHYPDRKPTDTLANHGKLVAPIPKTPLKNVRKVGGGCGSWASRHSYLATLKAALRWAVKRKLLPACPEIDMPPAGKSKGRPIVTEEYERILSAIPKIVGDSRADSWTHFITGLWLSGLRLGEALSLSWDEDAPFRVDMSGKHPRLKIVASAQKSRKDELLPLTPDFAGLLMATPEAERVGRVFRPAARRGNKVAAQHTVIATITAISEKAGVAVGKRAVCRKATGDSMTKTRYSTAHDFRRAFGTRWAKRVMPAVLKRLMRHADIQTTMTFYVALDADELAEDLWKSHGPQASNNMGNKGEVDPMEGSVGNRRKSLS